MCNEIKGLYDEIIITIVSSYTRIKCHSFVDVGIVTCNNTDSNKLMIFSGIASHCGDYTPRCNLKDPRNINNINKINKINK